MGEVVYIDKPIEGVAYKAVRGVVPAASFTGNVQLLNPVGSACNVMVDQIGINNVQVGASVASEILIGRYDTSVGTHTTSTPCDIRVTRVSKATASGYNNNNTPVPSPIWDVAVVNPDQCILLRFQRPIVLSPGTGLLIHSVQNSVDLDAMLEWLEVDI